jgi:hypothetical protein
MVRGFLFKRATGGAVASPFEGGLGGSAPLLVRFLGASEKMNKFLLLLFEKMAGSTVVLLVPLRKLAKAFAEGDFGGKAEVTL